VVSGHLLVQPEVLHPHRLQGDLHRHRRRTPRVQHGRREICLKSDGGLEWVGKQVWGVWRLTPRGEHHCTIGRN
jgi:hypothetical protein